MNKVVIVNDSVPHFVLLTLEKLGLIIPAEKILKDERERMKEEYLDRYFNGIPIDKLPRA